MPAAMRRSVAVDEAGRGQTAPGGRALVPRQKGGHGMAEGTSTGGGGAPRAVARNIEEVVRLEEEAARRRPPSSRVADLVAGFAGTSASGCCTPR
jgi:hypothetical protein